MSTKQKIRSLTGRPVVILLVSVTLLVALLLFTDPRKVPIIVLLLPFVLLFLVIFESVSLALHRFMPRLSSRKRKIIAATLGGLPCFLLLLSSINQLTWRDVTLVTVLLLLGLFYSSRANFTGGRSGT